MLADPDDDFRDVAKSTAIQKAVRLMQAIAAANWTLRHRALSGGGFRHAEHDPSGPYLEDTLTFIFETQLPIRPTRFALETETSSEAREVS